MNKNIDRKNFTKKDSREKHNCSWVTFIPPRNKYMYVVQCKEDWHNIIISLSTFDLNKITSAFLLISDKHNRIISMRNK